MLRTDEKPDMPSRGRRSENSPDEFLPLADVAMTLNCDGFTMFLAISSSMPAGRLGRRARGGRASPVAESSAMRKNQKKGCVMECVCFSN